LCICSYFHGHSRNPLFLSIRDGIADRSELPGAVGSNDNH
jgi:hypothetical protein